ncbi:hypothetical protein [Streptomyces sp. NPDC049040]|uniref:hypothetical protein n=1 Tax=Streptomyces sp. NPDC049040 TaxID=3365593 RepID=UPI003719DEED
MTISLNSGEPSKMRTGGKPFFLEASIQFMVEERRAGRDGRPIPRSERYKVSTKGYMYTITTEDSQEVLGFHWHPGREAVDEPHLHVGTVNLVQGAPITRKQHIMVGRVAFEDVLGTLMQMGVVPSKVIAPQVLETNLDTFKRYRTWS